jgi:nucleotidyltransferase substrate binding protein (TIGR01987 family)
LEQDIRWVQRFYNFIHAFRELEEAVILSRSRTLSKLEKQGLIQGFEYTHELAWNVLKDYLTEQGIIGLIGSKDSTRDGFKRGLLEDGEVWMDMIKTRNLTSHTYDAELAETVFLSIIERFYPAFLAFSDQFNRLLDKENP